MRAINISNDKARNAQVGFEVKKEKSDIVMARPDGMAYENARFLKSTINQYDKLFLAPLAIRI